ncbi:MFS transporter [Xanthomonas euroxanthea]|jgi:predicted MFS family arabinose efflux permease|uniref:MFS transporter n=1 Tax=Xanthomonas euroxanthea TaxID=2259622 RepID=A0A8E4H386_9XANT|nr:MFS transporter [Xanthomonas euroxanthea]CAD1791590.1 MFS transporter [Xanthomonas euroxanthea]SYZ56445.1 MFS transporter [Xanthomonas arboricola pv. juglandis]
MSNESAEVPTNRPNNLAISSTASGWAIGVLSLAAFVIVTTEFIIVGLIPALSKDLGISISMAGQLVTIFAFTIALAGPFMTACLSRYERRQLFVWILVAFAVCNAAAALSPNYWTLMVARLIPAALVPVFWGIGSDAAGQIVRKEKAGKAVAQVYFGVTAALLFGIPLGTVLGDAVGWRGTFWVLAAISLGMVPILLAVMPKVPAGPDQSLLTQVSILKSSFFLANLILSLAIFTAMFAAYTYLADMLESIAGIPSANVGWWLMGFGAVGLVGNYVAGRLVDKYAVQASVLFCVLLAVGAVSAAVIAEHLIPFIAALAVWGVAHTALFPLSQIRVMNAATAGKALAGTLNISAANAGIGLGALLGGWAISHGGIAIACFGAGILIGACAIATPIVERMRPTSPSTDHHS